LTFSNDVVPKAADTSDKSEGDAMDVDGKRKKKTPSRWKNKTDDDEDNFRDRIKPRLTQFH
jgi:hypothetical protein